MPPAFASVFLSHSPSTLVEWIPLLISTIIKQISLLLNPIELEWLVRPLRVNLVYPAALTAFGLAGNAYLLGIQIRDVRADLGGQIEQLKGDMVEVKHDMAEVKHDVKGLLARQTALEVYDMSVAEKLLMDCGKKW